MWHRRDVWNSMRLNTVRYVQGALRVENMKILAKFASEKHSAPCIGEKQSPTTDRTKFQA